MSEYINFPLFFLGANSSDGFVSRFESAYSPDGRWRCYIIKGGPGTGKSTFIRRIISAMAEQGEKIEIIPCSSDPSSLDAAIFPDKKIAVFDGTAPHVWSAITHKN